MFDRLAGRDSDAHLERLVGILLAMMCEFLLDVDAAANRGRSRHESCHDAVTGVLDFAAAGCAQRFSNNAIVHLEHGKRHLVPQTLSHICRADNVGEQNRAGARVTLGVTGQESRASIVDFGRAHEGVCHLGRYLHDPRSLETMRLFVHGICGFGTWRRAQTEDLAVLLVQPIFDVFDAVSVLNFLIVQMRRRDIAGLYTRHVVNVDVRWHAGFSPGLEVYCSIASFLRKACRGSLQSAAASSTSDIPRNSVRSGAWEWPAAPRLRRYRGKCAAGCRGTRPARLSPPQVCRESRGLLRRRAPHRAARC